MGLKPRVVRHHIARLERVGLWVRIGRKGQTNLYGLHLPGEAQEGFVQPRPRHARAAPPGTHVPPKCSLEVLRAPSGRSAAYSKNGVVRTPEPVTTAAPLKGSPVPTHSSAWHQQNKPSRTSTPCLPLSLSVPLPPQPAARDPSTPSTFNLDPDLEARFVEQDRLYHAGEKGVALSLDTPQIYRGGCPQCGHERMMGGSCHECGYDDQTGFRPSADCNKGG